MTESRTPVRAVDEGRIAPSCPTGPSVREGRRLALFHWALIVAAFAVRSIWTNPLTILRRLCFLAAPTGSCIARIRLCPPCFRESKAGNDFIGHWLLRRADEHFRLPPTGPIT